MFTYTQTTKNTDSVVHLNQHMSSNHTLHKRQISVKSKMVILYLAGTSVRPKGFFSFRPKPKIAETAIFLFGRNRYRNRKKVSLSAETDTETETTVLKKSAII